MAKRKRSRRIIEPTVICVELTADHIDDVLAWVEDNIDAICVMYSAHISRGTRKGLKLPPPEHFEDFCRQVHQRMLCAMADDSATLH